MIGDLGYSLTSDVLREMGPERRRSMAADVAECVLGAIARPYPCSEIQTLTCDEDLSLPRERYRVFHGSFDWHSCVHSHWCLVRLASQEGLLAPELCERVIARLSTSFSPELLAEEARTWAERLPAHEERPYGHTWLLVLDAELGRVASEGGPLSVQAATWREALAPMTAEMTRRVREWVAGLALPVRSGLHSDTGWSLAMAWDWAQAVEDNALAEAVRAAALRVFGHDVNAPVAYEPQGQTFTSSILNEAAAMARVLEAGEYEAWLRGFLPQAFGGSPSAVAPLLADLPGTWDGENYFGVHEVALPFSRAIAARDAAAPLPAGSEAQAYLAAQASRWMRQGAEGLTLDGYLADHWVGSFVAASLVRWRTGPGTAEPDADGEVR